MTENGRGPGSEPWYPDDPLYGDQGWQEGQPPAYDGQPGHEGWHAYGAQQQHHYGQPHHHQQPQNESWDTTGQYYPPGGYGQQHAEPYDTGQHGQHGGHQDPYGGHHGGHQDDPYGGQPGYAQPPQHQQQHYPPHDQQSQQYPPPHEQADYRGSPHHPQDHQDVQQPAPPQDAAPRAGHRDPGPDPDTGWDPGPDQGEADFFSRRDDEDEPADTAGRTARRGGERPRRGRGGCLVMALVIVGGVGGAGYWGYQEYQARFGPAPDYAGEGTGQVEVEIPQGATSSDIGNLLREHGVVRSHAAFVEAALADEELAASIQPGTYNLRQQMSAESALQMLTDPAARSVLTVVEGWRATQVYAAIDERLGLAEGTTEDVAAEADLGLPGWAEGDPEGFLHPATYPVGSNTEPDQLLREMIDQAEAVFAEMNLEAGAESVGMTPREALTTASLVQAEAQEAEDFGRVSRVVHNRLAIDMMLQFDSTINYALGRSTLDVTIEDTELDSPYNTYQVYGLPPGPINNPGQLALESAVAPTEGDWLYFVTVSPGDTRFTGDAEEHNRNVEDFNEQQAQN